MSGAGKVTLRSRYLEGGLPALEITADGFTKQERAEQIVRHFIELSKLVLEKNGLKGYAGYAVRAIVKKGRI